MGEANRKLAKVKEAAAQGERIPLNHKTVLRLHEAYCRMLGLGEAAAAAQRVWMKELASAAENLGVDAPLEKITALFVDCALKVEVEKEEPPSAVTKETAATDDATREMSESKGAK